MGLFNKEKKEQYKIVNPPTENVSKPIEEVMNEKVLNENSTDEEEVVAKEEPVTEEEKILQVPVFLTQADVNRLTYENNIMLKRLMEAIQKE